MKKDGQVCHFNSIATFLRATNHATSITVCYRGDDNSIMVSIPINRKHASLIPIFDKQDTLWFTGGLWGQDAQSVTNYITQNGALQIGPYMPIGVEGHCSLLLSNHRIMISGGSFGAALSSDFVDFTLIYDFMAKSWTEGPVLSMGRTRHSCGMLKSEGFNKTIVVNVGGHCNRDFDVDCVEASTAKTCTLEHLDLDDGSFFQCGTYCIY